MATPAAILSILVQAKGIATTKAQLERLNQSAEDTNRHVDQMSSKFRGFGGALGDFNKGMTAARNNVALIKFPALIAGAGVAAQAVGALGAAAVATGAALAPLAGGGAAVGVAYTAMGQAMGVAKLATLGLEDAIKGQKGAMDKLSPVQRDFVKQIRGLKEETQGLRGEAQRGLLPGLGEGLSRIIPLFNELKPVVRATAEVMGDLAERAGTLAASWKGDLLTVGRANVKIIGNIGAAALSAANAARNLIAAASPLAVWLSRLTAQGAKWVSTQISAARSAGTLAKFFGETRLVMISLGRIIGNLVVGFVNIGKAAFPLGKGLIQDFAELTRRFREWTASVQGQNTLVTYFDAARGPIVALVGLIGDLGRALLTLSAPTPLTTDLINQLRTLVPIFQQVIANTTAALGPALITAIGNIARLVAVFAGASGPLTLYVQLIGALAGALASLLGHNAGLSAMVVTLVGFRSVLAATTFLGGPFVKILRAMGAAYLFVATGQIRATATLVAWRAAMVVATVATIAQRAAAIAVAAATRVWTVAQVALNVALTANPIGLVIVGVAALGAAIVVAYNRSKTFRDVVSSLANVLRTALIATIDGVLGAFSSMLSAIARVARAVGADGLAKRAAEGARAIDDLRDSLRQVPEKKNVEVAVKIKLDGQDVDVSGAKPLSGTPPGGDGPGVIGSRIASKVRSSSAVKNAAKNAASVIPATGGAVGSLMGASSALGPFAAVGAKFGLHVTSGLRPGSVTSSGNVSYHSSGRAVDLGNGRGPDAAKLAAFRALKSRYGSRLAELIYTPGGVGIKNGQPFRYTGQVAADHFDHVHVAFTGGRTASALGQAGNRGDGFGVGDGIGDVARLARGAGFKGDALTTAIAVAGAESGFRSKASNRNSNGSIDRGYWQINSVHGSQSTFSPSGNARAAFKISSGGRNWRPWVAYNSGAYRRFLDQARSAAANATGGRGGGATNSSNAAATVERVSPFDMATAQADVAIADTQAGKAFGMTFGGRPVTGVPAQARALTAKRKLIGARIQKIRADLASGKIKNPATRLARTQELGQLLSQHADLGTQVQDLRKGDRPTAADFLTARTAQAKLTPGLQDDLSAAQATVTAATGAYQKAVGTGDPRKIAEAADALKSASDNLESVSETMKDIAIKSQFDWSDASIALASLTDSLDDDRVALEQRRALDAAMLADAQARNDPAAIAQFANALHGDMEAIKQLDQTLKDQQAAMEEHTKALQDLEAQIKEQNQIASTTVAIGLREAQRALADVISHQIGAVGVGGRALTAGAGTVARY